VLLGLLVAVQVGTAQQQAVKVVAVIKLTAFLTLAVALVGITKMAVQVL
jgi:hypothetical protein